ncbi:MAG: carbon storage regulator [Phycisphaerales bacterium]
MLVITRREGEEVVIGDPANPQGIVRIAQIKGDRVRIAFQFPREVEVHRREVAEQIVEKRPEAVVGSIRPKGSSKSVPG